MAKVKFNLVRHLRDWRTSNRKSRQLCALIAAQLRDNSLDDDARQILIEALDAGATGGSIDENLGLLEQSKTTKDPTVIMSIVSAFCGAMGAGHGRHKEPGGAYYEVAQVFSVSPSTVEATVRKFRKENPGVMIVPFTYNPPEAWRALGRPEH